MRRLSHILFLLPYVVAALIVAPVALWIKWSVLSRLGIGIPDSFLAHAVLVVVAIIFASGLVSLLTLLIFCAVACLHGLAQLTAEYTRPASPRTIRRNDSLGMNNDFKC